MPIASISAAFSSAKVVLDIAKGISSLSKSVEINSKVIELQETILSLQQIMSNVEKEHSETENKLKNIIDWVENTASHYFLQEVASGAFIYALKQEFIKPDEPLHWICPKCYQERKKSILQAIRKTDFNHDAECPDCKFYVSVKLKDELAERPSNPEKNGWMMAV